MLTAITRAISDKIAECELSFLPRQPIDLARAREQHRQYEEALAQAGAQRIIRLPAEPDLPDSVFVEDTAVVLDELAVIARPGAESRRDETASVAEALSAFRPLAFIESPATLEGGDVMRVDRTLYVGLSARTNQAGVDQLRAIVEPHGYRVSPVEISGCLHLKTACTYLGRRTILANRRWINIEPLAEFALFDVHEEELWAANTLTIGDTVLMAEGALRTRARLEERGFKIRTIDNSELRKAEAGLTCSSLIFDINV